MYAVGVKFCQQGHWTKTYVYKSEVSYEKDAIVLVRYYDFYTLGKVVGSKSNYHFSSELDYKTILKEIKLDGAAKIKIGKGT